MTGRHMIQPWSIFMEGIELLKPNPSQSETDQYILIGSLQ